MKTTGTVAPATRRLRFTASVAEDRFHYLAGQVADVPAPLAAELMRTGLAVETRDPERRPRWATCCATSWIAQRVLPDDRVVQRWSDEDPTLPPAWTQCHVCRRGWLL